MSTLISTVGQNDPNALLPPEPAGKFLGGMSGTWMIEHTRKAPKIPFVRFGRRIFFRRSDLIEFAAKHAKS